MLPQKYKHLFFDLDHTLWDFETNSLHTLEQLFEKYHLGNNFESFKHFYDRYEAYNDELWELYRLGKINKAKLNFDRFHTPFSEAGLKCESTAENFASDYITVSPTKTMLMPNTLQVLEALKRKHQLHIITNGFKEVQFTKLKNSKLKPFFTKVFISETIGASKPKRSFFEHAVKSTNARKSECLVIGDNLKTDIDGAINFGLDYVFFNPQKKPHTRTLMHEISDLQELHSIV
ncbi:YjjG family noncanonical pyrimidine nucleotidase [Saccharicrinis aurantiacus]|uniref:YjjG family noncanonical pyrimidine nucleotidase n=1 Tax=Saccharicrinis aurantiacus TaxID=1849719 RepID=UPI00249027BE|nr:YjjG family noncanonical pyrimidine nucleotidase [Saccharicrinis aurantiacus]